MGRIEDMDSCSLCCCSSLCCCNQGWAGLEGSSSEPEETSVRDLLWLVVRNGVWGTCTWDCCIWASVGLFVRFSRGAMNWDLLGVRTGTFPFSCLMKDSCLTRDSRLTWGSCLIGESLSSSLTVRLKDFVRGTCLSAIRIICHSLSLAAWLKYSLSKSSLVDCTKSTFWGSSVISSLFTDRARYYRTSGSLL